MHRNEAIRKLLTWKLSLYFIHILDKKIIQNGILSTEWHLISLKKLLLLCLTQILKAMLKMHINARNGVQYINNGNGWYYASKYIQWKNMCIFLDIF